MQDLSFPSRDRTPTVEALSLNYWMAMAVLRRDILKKQHDLGKRILSRESGAVDSCSELLFCSFGQGGQDLWTWSFPTNNWGILTSRKEHLEEPAEAWNRVQFARLETCPGTLGQEGPCESSWISLASVPFSEH